MAVPTPEELELVKELHSRISDIVLDEYEGHDKNLLRWLRARNLNLEDAEQMLRKSMQFRLEFGMESILSWKAPPYYEHYFPYQHSGFDKDGFPIVIVPACWWEPYVRKELAAGMKDSVFRYITQVAMRHLEKVKLIYKRDNRLIFQFVIVFDLRGLTLKHCSSIKVLDVLFESIRRFEANFPETLKVAYVINAPKIFSFLHALLKPIMSARTYEKAIIFDSNIIKWQNALLQNISKDQLPKYYGGTMKDILCDGMKLFENVQEENKMNEIIIEPGGEFALEYEISIPGTLISWIFKTDKFNIGFTVNTIEKKVLIPYQRLDSHETIQHGSVTCLNEGKYVLNFDNTFSRFRAKTLYYLVTTSEPKPDEFITMV